MKTIIFLCSALFLIACGDKSPDSTSSTASDPDPHPAVSDRGVGEIDHVELNDPLNSNLVERGKAIYEMKCAACHKLTDQRVVGPGWKGITERRKPEWIMNMSTNPDVMLSEDPVARELLKQCLVRMPNQNLSIGDARDVLEYMYANDGHVVGE